MFNCQVCASNGLVKWFISSVQRPPQRPGRRVRDPAAFRPPTEAQIVERIARWAPYLHRRSMRFLGSDKLVAEALRDIARGISADQDLLLDDQRVCVHWYGTVVEEGVPAITLIQPDHPAGAVCYVSRAVAFMFADDDSFAQLVRLPQNENLQTTCGDLMCVHIKHICRGSGGP
eukprot:TRINITY_DN30957_c0_g1_i1.p1 TRINITY_DN30957_c0_g1~~TRINITY_DN30957_c0_g1_i1.p1  ORF type:complete len:174 (-),score=22.83 TRINITY_DN30957_c0_g1_i1:329-850(-)